MLNKIKINKNKIKIKYLRIAIIVLVIASLFFSILPVKAAPSVRYWVGGSGNSNDTAHWDYTDGGPGGDPVPDFETDVYFNANSGFTALAHNWTVNAAFNCHDMIWTGAPNNPNIIVSGVTSIYGSLVLIAGMTFGAGGQGITFRSISAGETITMAGVNDSVILGFNGVGGEWTLQDDLELDLGSSTLTISNGKLITGGFDVTLGTNTSFSVAGGGTNYLDLGASTLTTHDFTYSGDGLDAGTSTIICSGEFWSATGQTYYDVELTGATTYIQGSQTFHDLTRTGTTTYNSTLELRADQTINGTLTLNGNSVANRLQVYSDTRGTTRTLTAAVVSASYVNFEDITGAGGGSWDLSAITGGSGDRGGNANITFTTADDMYWHVDSGDWWDPTKWFLETNGAGGAGRVPLPQDTAKFDANSFDNIGRTISNLGDMQATSAIDCTGVANAPIFNPDSTVYVYGSVNLTGSSWQDSSINFKGRRADVTFTCTGITFSSTGLYIDVMSAYKLTLQSNFVTSGGLSVYSGTLDINDKDVTISSGGINAYATYTSIIYFGNGTITTSYFDLDAAGTCTLYMEDSTVIITGTTGWDIDGTLTVTASTSEIKMNVSTAGTYTFDGGGKNYNDFTIYGASTGTVSFTDSNSFSTFTIDRSIAAKTISGTVTNTVAALIIAPNGVVTVTVSNVDFNKPSGIVNVDYMNFNSGANTCTAAGGATFYAGAHSITAPQTGWIFLSPTIPTITTNDATVIYQQGAKLNGSFTMGEFLAVNVYFEYDDDNIGSYDFSTSPVAKVAAGDFDVSLTGLSPTTVYYFRGVITYDTPSIQINGSQKTFSTAANFVYPGVTGDAVLEAAEPPKWWTTGTELPNLPFYETFDAKATEMGMDLQTLYLMAAITVAICVGFGVLLFTGSTGLGIAGCAVTMGIGTSMTIVSGWMIFVFIIIGGGLWILSKFI